MRGGGDIAHIDFTESLMEIYLNVRGREGYIQYAYWESLEPRGRAKTWPMTSAKPIQDGRRLNIQQHKACHAWLAVATARESARLVASCPPHPRRPSHQVIYFFARPRHEGIEMEPSRSACIASSHFPIVVTQPTTNLTSLLPNHFLSCMDRHMVPVTPSTSPRGLPEAV